MATAIDATVRGQLQDRRQHLEHAIARGQASLEGLLQEVDSALARIQDGSYGRCEVCRDPIEPERLLADPLVRFCLDHLTPGERRHLEDDLELAARIQSGLLPSREVRIEGWEVHTHYQPAGVVSGDYYDVIRPEARPEEACFVLGDVSGKGVAASILMANLQAIFRSLVSVGLPVEALMERANRVFCESTLPSSYATLVCGRLGPRGQVDVANAGHCPPLLLRADRIDPVPATGLPLGMFCSGRFPTLRHTLLPGDLLLLYTDGLSETENAAGEPFGAERIQAALASHRDASPRAVVEGLLKELVAFRGSGPPRDDLTLMAIRRAG